MVHAAPSHTAFDEHAAPVRALSSLTRRDVEAVRATVRAIGADLIIEEHDDYDGYRSLLLTPRAGGRCFLVSGRTRSVEVSQIDGDDMTVLGAFASIGGAMQALRPALERGAALASARQATGAALELLETNEHDAPVQAALAADQDAYWSSVMRAVDVLRRLPCRT